MNDSAVLELIDVTRHFKQGGNTLKILNGVSLKIMPGEIVALTGASGSGKSTLLQIAGLLEPPSTGNIVINGQLATAFNDDQRTRLRRESIGFVYQFHHLLPEFSALENILLPQMIAGNNSIQSGDRGIVKIVGFDKSRDTPTDTIIGW